MKKLAIVLMMLFPVILFGASTYISGVTDTITKTYNNIDGVTMDNKTSYTVTGVGVAVTVLYDFNIDNKNGITINVLNGASLIVNGDFITKNNVTINVDDSSIFSILGNLQAKNGSALTISGVMDVAGDVFVEQKAYFDINEGGSLAVDGSLSVVETGTIELDGDLSVGEDLYLGNGADLKGTGTVTAGSYSGTGTIFGSTAETLDPGTSYVDGGGSAVLPIELTVFTAYKNNNSIEIYWQTATELNNHYFNIERSYNAVDFEIIATITGAGNSSVAIDYYFTDNTANGNVYYRLKQTDYNGDFSYSDIVSVKTLKNYELDIETSVSSNYIQIKSFKTDSQAQVVLYNIIGQPVYTGVLNSDISIETSGLQKTVYILTVTNAQGTYSKKIQVK